MLSFGIYPDTPLWEARNQREAARQSLAKGIDPGAERRIQRDGPKGTFESVARHYLAGLARKVRINKRSIKTFNKAKAALETYVYPELG